MNEELKVLLTIADNLDTAGIPYMISGSMASNYYTIPRMTRDIDVVVQLKQENSGRFIGAFGSQFWVDAEVVDREILKQGMFNLIHKEYVIKADFILSKSTDFQASAFKRRKKIVIENCPVWMISAEDLILAKLLWAKESFSELQIKDVRHLLSTVDQLDHLYLGQWVLALGLGQVYEKVKHE